MTDKCREEQDVPLEGPVSRRRLLVQSTGAAAGLLSGCATSSKVQGAMPQAQAQYQDHPSGLERCGVCKHFIPRSGCEIVAAPVQANGWCKLYALF